MGSRLSPKVKAERGIDNDVTGHLLCPIDYDWGDLEYVPLYSSYLCRDGIIDPFSVHAKLRNSTPGYNFTSSLFL
jgi:hypothetical protein